MTPGGRRGERRSVRKDPKQARVLGCHDFRLNMDKEDTNRLDELEDQCQEAIGEPSEDSQTARTAVSPLMTLQQPYIKYQQSSYLPYLGVCESGGASYQRVSSTLIQSYPGFHYPLYGKTAGREESELTPPTKGVSSKQISNSSSSSSSVEPLQQQSLQYHENSPEPGERGSPEAERETAAERNQVLFSRHLHSHHHSHLGLSYNLMSGPYHIYQGLSSRPLVSGQQVSGHSSTDSEVKK